MKAGQNRVAIVLIDENGTDEATDEVKPLLILEDVSVVDYSDSKKKELFEIFNITATELKQ